VQPDTAISQSLSAVPAGFVTVNDPPLVSVFVLWERYFTTVTGPAD
jgi:hypothetical protein